MKISTDRKYIYDKRIEMIDQLKKDGYSDKDVAEIMRLDPSTLCRILNKEIKYKRE
jgi:hypothetical protein